MSFKKLEERKREEMAEEDTVTISVEEYDSLKQRDQWLLALEDAGVDNWQGIDFAYETFEGWNNE